MHEMKKYTQKRVSAGQGYDIISGKGNVWHTVSVCQIMTFALDMLLNEKPD